MEAHCRQSLPDKVKPGLNEVTIVQFRKSKKKITKDETYRFLGSIEVVPHGGDDLRHFAEARVGVRAFDCRLSVSEKQCVRRHGSGSRKENDSLAKARTMSRIQNIQDTTQHNKKLPLPHRPPSRNKKVKLLKEKVLKIFIDENKHFNGTKSPSRSFPTGKLMRRIRDIYV